MNILERMTNAQLELLAAERAIAFDEYQRALNKMLQADKARAALGVINERGNPVTSGCNMQMTYVHDRWSIIAQEWGRVCRDIDEKRWITIQEAYIEQRNALKS